MKMDTLKIKAKAMGLKTSGMTKTDIIRAIQQSEGNFPCYGTARDYCDQWACAWREDCLPHTSGRTRSRAR